MRYVRTGTQPNPFITIPFLALAALAAATASLADDFQWVGLCAGSSDWFCPANWQNTEEEPKRPIPIFLDDAAIETGQTMEITHALLGPASVSTLALGDLGFLLGGTLLVAGTGELSVASLEVANSAFSRVNVTGGSIYASAISVGDEVAGIVNLSGGLISCSTRMKLGTSATGQGNLFISGGTLRSGVEIGVAGSGQVLQTGGQVGTTDDTEVLLLGVAPGASGSYTIDAGSLHSDFVYVGDAGTGTFHHHGGTHWSNGATGMVLADDATAAGYYFLTGGSLDFGVSLLYVGSRGFGEFEQTGGTADFGWVNVGRFAGSQGSYAQSGGSLNVGVATNGPLTVGGPTGSTGLFVLESPAQVYSHANLAIGTAGVGEFRQSGGALTVNLNLTLAGGSTGRGTFVQDGGTAICNQDIVVGTSGDGVYELRGGALSIGDDMTFATNPGSTGLFQHTGGSVIVSDGVLIRSSGAGRYELGGAGDLLAGTERISSASGGVAQFYQSGGSNRAAVSMCIGCDGSGSRGLYVMQGGTLTTPVLTIGSTGLGWFEITGPSASVTVTQQLLLGPTSSFRAIAGSSLRLAGATLDNQSTRPDSLADLFHLNLIFENGPAALDSLEVAGRNYGAHADGLAGNFALGRLTLGDQQPARVRLVDRRDNQPGSTGPEALYVDRLVMGPGCYLDLAGQDLFYREGAIDPTATIALNGGHIAPISLPTGVAPPEASAPSPLPVELVVNPMPVVAGADIRFSLPVQSHVLVSIYDVAGRRISALIDGPQPAGSRNVFWNATDESGAPLASGIYFVRLQADGLVLTRRVVVQR